MSSIRAVPGGAAAGLWVLAAVAATAGGAVTYTHDEGAFIAANAIVSTETFDSIPYGTILGELVVTIDSVTYSAPDDPRGGEYTPTWRAGGGVTGARISQPNGLLTHTVADRSLSFGAGQYVHAIGFWMATNGVYPVPHWEIFVEEIDGSVHGFDAPLPGPITQFWGLSSGVGIERVTLSDWPHDSGRVNFLFDNVSRSRIAPEPATLALLAAGAVSVGSVRSGRRPRGRRRRSRRGRRVPGR